MQSTSGITKLDPSSKYTTIHIKENVNLFSLSSLSPLIPQRRETTIPALKLAYFVLKTNVVSRLEEAV